MMAIPNHRTTLSYVVVLLFLVSFLWVGFQNNLHTSIRKALAIGEILQFSCHGPAKDFRSFHSWTECLGANHLQGYPNNDTPFLRTITADELKLDKRRLIFVGDIHGMKSSIDKLLFKLSYNSSRDLLLHLGDIVAKGPDSLRVLKQFSEANITGVRGNHEQRVIEWRAWINWVEGHHGGKQWLKKLEQKYPHGFDSKKQKQKLKWAIPEEWEFTGDHYNLARDMTTSQYDYLRNLPLVIHLPSLHTFAVHAGILPFDPKYPPDASRQPLAHMPTVSSPLSSDPIRNAQEQALLTDIKQNTDPWVLVNIRSVLRNGDISRNVRKGTPWPDLWDKIMKQCHGYHYESTDRVTLEREEDIGSSSLCLSCLPINVVFGHSASRGLDVKRWSFGLDDGCVKGRHLTAMLISNMTDFTPVVNAKTRNVAFGEHSVAQLVSIRC